MAGPGVWIRLLERHRARLTKDPDMNRVVPKLIKRRFFSDIEERQLAGATDASERTDLLLDKLSRDPDAFREFCMTLEECAPHLLTELLLDRGEIFRGGDSVGETDSQALELGFELALKERDVAVREQARAQEDLVEARRQLATLQHERDLALNTGKGKTSGSSLHRGHETDEPHLVEESGDNVVWQIHRVTLQRVANYGFGIAVSGGHDSPHFASGDPSIAISDVLQAGPAEGKLQLNDRIISVNGISLENVSHSMAIQVLKNSGDSVHLVVRRRVVMPAAVEKESPPLRVTLVKKNKKDEFGLVLGCRFFIQDVLPESLAAQDGGLKIGDTILKVNNTTLEGLSVGEVKKLMERSKDRLQLIVSKPPHTEDRVRSSASRLREDEGYSTFRPAHDKGDVNLYRPSVRSEEDLYPGAYPAPGSAHFDSRYGYNPDAPPRPTMSGTFPRTQHRSDSGPHSPTRAENFYSPPPRRDPDGYYSDHDMDGYRGPPAEDVFTRHPPDERYVGLRSDLGTDIRRVVFQKDRQKGLGLRLAGGNATGIFIASVQPGSGAEAEGLVEGDQILQANGLDIVGLTREEAVAHLTSLEGKVTLIVQYRKEDYDSIMASHEAGDSFYIRTDIRRVVFQKDRQKGLGLRLAGGNATGIFIASVQPGSGAEAEGLVEGDQILQANGLDIVGLTREEAVAHLTSLEGKVTLIVQYRKEGEVVFSSF
ncbi:tight junction protein 1-like [Babylonia areolata]|uniref:tight junction protein 1-like n=1 Tax=Babylonia areolata TaxID=304850 RepID=UPI003FD2C821